MHHRWMNKKFDIVNFPSDVWKGGWAGLILGKKDVGMNKGMKIRRQLNRMGNWLFKSTNESFYN